jgi:phage terminase large subunit-like protein
LAGRGTGKTRAAVEWLVWKAIRRAKTRWLVAAPTFGDVRDVCAEGESGLIVVLEEYEMLRDYNRSLGDIYLKNGSRIKLISGEKPARFRGPQFHGGWLDELATFNKPESFDQARIVLRLPGEKPQLLVTTTPQPTPLMRALVDAHGVVISRGKTADNAANLTDEYLATLEAMYGDTRLWRQEILGELLEDVEGALWLASYFQWEDEPLEWKRKIIGVDPAITNTVDSDETGIIVAGRAMDNRLGVIADYSCKDSATGWAKRVLEAFKLHGCELIIVESTQGGEVWLDVIHSIDPYAPVKLVPATKSKRNRAQPVAALYEQHKVFHVKRRDNEGREVKHLGKLEDQYLTWKADDPKSPDRLDAAVHALTELAGITSGSRFMLEIATICGSCKMPNEKGATVCSSCHQKLDVPQPVVESINQWPSLVSRG